MSLPAESLHGRLGRLRVDALLFNNSEFLQSPNLRYLTGFTGSNATILVTKTERHFFTDGRYTTQAGAQVIGFQIHVVKRKLDAVANAVRRAGVGKLALEYDRVSHEFVTALARRLKNVTIVPLPKAFVENLRICKSPEEKSKVRKAAQIASNACREILERGLAGRTETEVAADLEDRFRRSGAEGIAFETIVASGARSALPHGKASDKTIEKGDLVIIDFGCRYQGYHSDETVTCSIGPPSSEQRSIYEAVRDAYTRAFELAAVGVPVRELDRVARQSIADAGYGKYFSHSLGHGVGLEIHEPPSLSPLGRGVVKEGMIFTIEPGIYVEGLAGVRLESLVYMGRDGPEILCEMPKDLIETG